MPNFNFLFSCVYDIKMLSRKYRFHAAIVYFPWPLQEQWLEVSLYYAHKSICTALTHLERFRSSVRLHLWKCFTSHIM
jgi:hypothetical protein